MTKEFIDFVNKIRDEDTARLLLSAARYPSIDMPAAVQQIEGLRTAKEKWPKLLLCDQFMYPPRINREQSSSEATALFKARMMKQICGMEHPVVADLTGGMGIDSMAMAHAGASIHYVERDPMLCSLMGHNSHVLGLNTIEIHCTDSIEWLYHRETDAPSYDLIYIDPARRDSHGRKVAAFDDCSPDILEHLSPLLTHGKQLLIKASPMIDIDLAVRQLGCVSDVYIISLHNECKEVLFLCHRGAGPTCIHSACLPSYSTHSFSRAQEAAAEPRYCNSLGLYLYEPDAALMKAGPFKLLCQWWDMPMLAPNTHLYTSDDLRTEFDSRIFQVLNTVALNRKTVRQHLPDGRANVICRNYPVAADTLRKQLGLVDGGDICLIATTVGNKKTGILARLLSH